MTFLDNPVDRGAIKDCARPARLPILKPVLYSLRQLVDVRSVGESAGHLHWLALLAAPGPVKPVSEPRPAALAIATAKPDTGKAGSGLVDMLMANQLNSEVVVDAPISFPEVGYPDDR